MSSLELFLKEFPKYSHGIERIREDFIKSGYEKFLWRETPDEWTCMKETSKKVSTYKHFPHDRVLEFLNQFSFDSNEVFFIFPKRNNSTFFIIKEVCSNAKTFAIINNIFPEDDTINYIAVFDKTNTNDIILMNHLAYSGYMSDVFGGYKLFNYGLSFYAEFCADDEVQYMLQRPNEIMHFLNYQTRCDTNPYIIYEVRKNIERIVRNYYKNEFELYMDLNYCLLPFMQASYNLGIKVENISLPFNWKTRKEEIKRDLTTSGVISSRWKNEQSLYLLVQKQFPDSIYQYQPTWLSPQSLDIFIPTLNIAIEYQGIQHYQAVDFFGGNNGYKHRLKLDKRKKQLCLEYNIKLIEWNYNYDISKENLNKFILEVINNT